jgi:hypothetical protein
MAGSRSECSHPKCFLFNHYVFGQGTPWNTHDSTYSFAVKGRNHRYSNDFALLAWPGAFWDSYGLKVEIVRNFAGMSRGATITFQDALANTSATASGLRQRAAVIQKGPVCLRQRGPHSSIISGCQGGVGALSGDVAYFQWDSTFVCVVTITGRSRQGAFLKRAEVE